MVSPREGKPRSAILRGGRLRKTARGVLTYAPWIGIVSALAMGATIALASTAAATADESSAPTPKGTCAQQTEGAKAGSIICTGADGINRTIDADISTYKYGIYLPPIENPRGDRGDTTLTVNGDITAGESGIFVHRELADDESGDISITANGDITAGGDGISVRHAWGSTVSRSNITIIANGDIVSEDIGIYARHKAAGDSTIIANGDIEGSVGINARTNRIYSGDMTITSNGDITATVGNGIDAAHRNRGTTRITNNGAISAKRHGISLVLVNPWPWDVTHEDFVTVNADITAGLMGIYILANGHPQSAFTVNVNPGVTISGGSSNPIYNAIYWSGDGTGILNLDSATLIGGIRTGVSRGNTIINIKGTVSITGTSNIEGTLNNADGTLSLQNGSTDDTFTVVGYEGGGTLALDMNLTTGDADSLIISGPVTGTATTVNLYVSADAGVVSRATFDQAGVLIAAGESTATDFTAGTLTVSNASGGETEFDFTLTRDSATGDWKLTAIGDIDAPPITGKCHGTGGTFLCSGAADAASDTTQRLTAGAGERLVVRDEAGFGIHVAANDGATTASGNAFIITGESGSTGMEIALDGDISAIAHGIRARHDGTGAVEVTTNGDIATIEGRGISIETGARATSLTIAANGAVSGGDDDTWTAIRAEHGGTGPVFVNATHARIDDVGVVTRAYGRNSEGRISGGENGIFVRHQGQQDSAIDITANGRISASINGIKARHQGDGDIIIDANGDIADARNGVYAKHRGDRGDVTVNVNGSIDAERKGVEARHRRAGDLRVSASAESSIASAWKGIEARHRGTTGNVIVTANGEITAGWKGIEARVVKGDGDIFVTASGAITGGRKGIEVRHQNNGAIDIATSGVIRDSRRGVEARHHGTGNIDILAGGSISARNLGIYARHTGSEGGVSIVVSTGAEIVGERKNGIRVTGGKETSIEVDVAGSVAGKQALFMRGGESQRLILRPGFALVGGAKGEGATLELADVPEGADAAEGRLDFDEVEFAGFVDLVKSGSGVWELTGEQLEKQGGRSAVVEEGVLRFSDLHFTMNAGSVFSVGESGTLELQGKNILDGGLKNRGSVSFAEGNAASTLEVTGDWDGGGTLAFNADLEAGTANALVVGGDASGATRVALRVSGRLEKGKGEAVEVIRVHGSAANDAFTGEGVSGALRYKLVADGAGAWSFHVVGDAPGVPTAEAYADALATLSQSASVMERFGANYWRTEAQANSGSASLTADVSNESNRIAANGIRSEMTSSRARAGIAVPVGNVLFAADMWQGAANSRISSAVGEGEIGIASHAASLSATWLAPNGFYADAQTQYTRFTGALQTGGNALASGNDGTGASVSTELGWRLNAPALAGFDTLRFAPQAQLTWSRIGFEDFSARDGLHVSLEDGTTAAARLGLAWEGEWHNLAGIGRIHGGINLHEPLDGTTTVNISGVSFANEQHAPGLDATLGFAYEWADGYALNLETTAAHQAESEEYGINLGVQIEF